MALKPKQPTPVARAVPLSRAIQERNKWLIWGDWKDGKTTLSASIPAFWKERGFDPETCRLVFLDCDDGFIPLVEKGAVEAEYMDSVQYFLCRNFRDIEQNTKEQLEILREIATEHGAEHAWIVVDNMQAVWEWARDHYALMTYGKLESEVAAEKRQEAVMSDGKTAPTFSPRNDYGIINPIHNNWADSIKFSGVSFMWLAPQKSVKENFFDEDEVPQIGPAGQKGNPGRVDHIIRVWSKEKPGVKGESKKEYYADIVQSRKVAVKKIPNPTYSLLRSLVRGEHPAVQEKDKPKKKKVSLTKKEAPNNG